MIDRLISVAVGFKGNEFHGFFDEWTQLHPDRVDFHELSSMSELSRLWCNHLLIDVLILRCYDKDLFLTETQNLNSAAQLHFQEHLPLIIVVDRDKLTHIVTHAYNISAFAVLTTPFNNEEFVITMDAVTMRALQRRRTLLIYSCDKAVYAHPLLGTTWLERATEQTVIHLDNTNQIISGRTTVFAPDSLISLTQISATQWVNPERVQRLGKGYLVLDDTQQSMLNINSEWQESVTEACTVSWHVMRS